MKSATANAIRKVQDYIKLPLIYDCWYVAGLSSEFTQDLSSKTLLERSVLFYRQENGELVALQNRCLHRSFPLDRSKRAGDDIVCGYHGIRYNSDGGIVDIPCQTQFPKSRLHKYPVFEQDPFIWIWMGDPEKANVDDIPETDCLTDPGWTAMWGRKALEGNYLLMIENLADLSHLPYLHENTFGADEAWATVPIETEREGDMVHYWRSTKDWKMAAPLYPPTLNYTGRDIDAKLGATIVSPAMCRGWTTVTINDAQGNEQKELLNEINHYLTPEYHNTAHYYWSFARNCDIDNEEFSAGFEHVVSAAFEEDRVATRFMQQLLDDDGHDVVDLNIAGDKSSMMVRHMIVELVGREAAP